ncbi:MAG: hypothetical protein JO317_05880 [Verrucomicrobiae bacterium]|nr:hypothetical protein [Verrucomicrobiae bacterium]
MNPKHAPQYFSEYRRGRLPVSRASALEELLATDSQLRAAYDADTRVEALLSLKRHEKPHSEVLDGFLAEFHRRQRAELVEQPNRLRDFLRQTRETFATLWSPLPALRYGGAAAVLALILGLGVYEHRQASLPPIAATLAEIPVANVPVVFSHGAGDASVDYVLQRVNYSGSQHGSSRFDF